MLLHPHPPPRSTTNSRSTRTLTCWLRGCWPGLCLAPIWGRRSFWAPQWAQLCPGVPEGLRTVEGLQQMRMQGWVEEDARGQKQPCEGQKRGAPVVVTPRPPLALQSTVFSWPHEAGPLLLGQVDPTLMQDTHGSPGSQARSGERRWEEFPPRPVTPLPLRLQEATEPPSRVSAVASPLQPPTSTYLPLRPSGALSSPSADDRTWAWRVGWWGRV